MQGGMQPGMDSPDQQGGGRRAGGGGGRGQGGGGGGGRGFANMSDEDRQKMRELRQKMQSASPEEQTKLQQQMNDLMAKAGVTPGGRGGDGRGGESGRGGDSGRGPGGPGGPGQGPGPRGAGRGMSVANPLDMIRRAGGGSPFTEEERKNAKLPLPPEQDSQVQALLRPGLLADVEIVVEKIPNALHVPTQAIFDKNGKPTVYVLQKNGRYEPREVQLMKQSESLMVLSSGVQPGEVIALSDPTAEKSDKKGKSAEKKSSSGAMNGMPGGK